MTRSRSARLFIALAALALAAAACGGDDEADADAGAEGTVTTAPPETTTTTSTTVAPAGGGAGVEVVESRDLGPILASDSITLYIFKSDNAGAPTCYDDCAASWPPLLADGDVTVGDGLDAALFDTVARDDGGEQVTVDGWPLYFFAGDAAPGDVNGQGVGEVWYVVASDGTAIDNS